MKADLPRQLDRLRLRCERRIWLQRVRRRLVPLLWYGATVFILAGSIHQLVVPLNPLPVSALAVIPALLLLGILIVRHKPTAQQGAAEADRLLHANSLFVSAWELCRAGAGNEGTGKLLLDRCRSALPEWSRSIRPAAPGMLSPSALVGATLGLAGLIFLLQPAQPRFQSGGRTTAPPPVVIDEESAGAIRELSELLDPRRPATSANAPGQGLETASTSTPRASAGQAEESAQAQQGGSGSLPVNLASPAPAPRAHLTTAPSFSASPGNSRKKTAPGASDQAPGVSSAGPIGTGEFDRLRHVDIETGSGNRVLAGDTQDQASRLLEPGPARAYSHQSPKGAQRHISARGDTYALSPQQRSLVWRYLVQLEETDDPKQ